MAVAGLAGGVLGTAVWLEPATAGHGTHLQLGLGECSILSATGFPCPMCGMTTTFALMAEGRLLSALATQPFGVVLFLVTVVAFATAAAELLDGRRRWVRLWEWTGRHDTVLAATISVMMLLGWAYKLWQMSGGDLRP